MLFRQPKRLKRNLGTNMDISHFKDDRGTLTSVEFANLPFIPARSFVVSSQNAGVQRGGHKTGCRQLVVLISGSAIFQKTDKEGNLIEVVLKEIGSKLELASDDFINYQLVEAGSSILVFAEASFEASLRERQRLG